MSTIIDKIYCDMDGVTVDFAAGVIKIFPEFVEGVTEANKKQDARMWSRISKYQQNGGEFWYDLQPMSDAFVLWDFIKTYNAEILTAAGQPHFKAGPQKLRWISEKFGADVKVHVVQRAVEKARFATPTAVLIDDKRKALDPWIAAGGIGILHTSAESTIAQLKQLHL